MCEVLLLKTLRVVQRPGQSHWTDADCHRDHRQVFVSVQVIARIPKPTAIQDGLYVAIIDLCVGILLERSDSGLCEDVAHEGEVGPVRTLGIGAIPISKADPCSEVQHSEENHEPM